VRGAPGIIAEDSEDVNCDVVLVTPFPNFGDVFLAYETAEACVKAERAGHLVDAVFRPEPVRQWVLTLPHRIRYRLAWGITTCAARWPFDRHLRLPTEVPTPRPDRAPPLPFEGRPVPNDADVGLDQCWRSARAGPPTRLAGGPPVGGPNGVQSNGARFRRSTLA
jgi:hypothetical protein